MKVLLLMLTIFLAVATGCRRDSGKNSVDLQQIETDDSNDYRYIFRDAIQEQEHKLNKYKKKDF